MVEVFRTNVQLQDQGEALLTLLSKVFSDLSISIDLSDCDKVLRVQGHVFSSDLVIELVTENGFLCEILE